MGVLNPILDNHNSTAMLGAEIILPALRKKSYDRSRIEIPHHAAVNLAGRKER